MAELDAYRKQIEHLRDEIRDTGSSNHRIAIAFAFILGLAAGVAGSYIAVDRVTNIIFCEKDAVKA